MDKNTRIKQKRRLRHNKRRKNKSQNVNPFVSIIKERDKQLFKAIKIKSRKIEKENRIEKEYSK